MSNNTNFKKEETLGVTIAKAMVFREEMVDIDNRLNELYRLCDVFQNGGPSKADLMKAQILFADIHSVVRQNGHTCREAYLKLCLLIPEKGYVDPNERLAKQAKYFAGTLLNN